MLSYSQDPSSTLGEYGFRGIKSTKGKHLRLIPWEMLHAQRDLSETVYSGQHPRICSLLELGHVEVNHSLVHVQGNVTPETTSWEQ